MGKWGSGLAAYLTDDWIEGFQPVQVVGPGVVRAEVAAVPHPDQVHDHHHRRRRNRRARWMGAFETGTGDIPICLPGLLVGEGLDTCNDILGGMKVLQGVPSCPCAGQADLACMRCTRHIHRSAFLMAVPGRLTHTCHK